MSRMQRWKMSVTGWVDGVLAQIENHEATVTASIGRLRERVYSSSGSSAINVRFGNRSARKRRRSMPGAGAPRQRQMKRRLSSASDATRVRCGERPLSDIV
jgi:hypothetical protein